MTDGTTASQVNSDPAPQADDTRVTTDKTKRGNLLDYFLNFLKQDIVKQASLTLVLSGTTVIGAFILDRSGWKDADEWSKGLKYAQQNGNSSEMNELSRFFQEQLQLLLPHKWSYRHNNAQPLKLAPTSLP